MVTSEMRLLRKLGVKQVKVEGRPWQDSENRSWDHEWELVDGEHVGYVKPCRKPNPQAIADALSDRTAVLFLGAWYGIQ